MDSQNSNSKPQSPGSSQIPSFAFFSKIYEARPVSAVHAVYKAGAEATVFMLAFLAAAWVAGKISEQGSPTSIIAATGIAAMVLASALIFASWQRDLYGKAEPKASQQEETET